MTGSRQFYAEIVMFLSRGLEKILAERDIKRSANSKLKKSAEEALECLKNESLEPAEKSSSTLPTPSDSSTGRTFDEEKYFIPFELACESKSTKIVIIALDCIQKLIAYGHFTGSRPNTRDEKGRPLIDSIVLSICGCFHGPSTDDGVQLQIIKALLTIVTSQHCPVHEHSILVVVRTCYDIYLASRNLINQTTAKATLTQMLNVIFSRMEANSVSKKCDTIVNNSLHSNSVNSNITINGEPQDFSSAIQLELSSIYFSTPKDSGDSVENVLEDVLDTVCKHSTSEMDSLASVALTSVKEGPSRSPSVTSVASSTVVSSDSFEPGDTIHLVFENLYQKDAYLVFRSLCKLSMKQLSDNQDVKSHELRSKILSLQLLLQILQNSGPQFQNSDMFAVAIKQYLCVALSKNGVSNIPEIFELSLAIFLALIQKFKIYLKMQIEVFFKEIFLNILETVSSSFEHKFMVIQALTRICADAQSVVDIYVNYDCDLSSENIFGRLVNDLSKIAQGGGQILDSALVTPIQEQNMRLKGLECLVSILQCMVEWSAELYVNPNEEQSSEVNGKRIDNKKTDKPEDETDNDRQELYDPNKFEVVKNQKNIIDKGIDMFNLNPKRGLVFLQHHGIINGTPESLAAFFHSSDRLDKSLVGEYMGDGATFNKEVMYAYVDQMDFSDRDIVSALRYFLEGFRLPGEAQKIDRFMEKFASQFFQSNKNQGIFASADTAYVLAFSIIMLTTDLHSPQVKRKMTKVDYIKMNRGINESKDLPEEYLSSIYDEIAESEIKVKGNPVKKFTGKEFTSQKARKALYNQEMESMGSAAKALMESVSNVNSNFTSAKHYEHIRPMFRTAWTSFLAAFSVGLQDCDDSEIAKLCLEGIRCAIRIACIFQMELETDAFVQALARFTLLNANCSLADMKTKNIDTIKTLITVANQDGNYLGKSWLEVLRCISQLELAQLIGTGVRPHSLNGKDFQMSSPSGAFAAFPFKLDVLGPLNLTSSADSSRHSHHSIKFSETFMEASSQSVVVAVDRIFTGSVRLDGNAIVDFVRALCMVSNEELNNNHNNPRQFSLQKIVEIAYYNISRIRLQWSRIWEVLGEHFKQVGCSRNEELAFVAIDSLRQLSMKFIEKGELSNFRFQKEFLGPFEYIMKNNNSAAIRDMVVRCIAQMVNSQASNIKSGWKNIFSVFGTAASEREAHIFDLAFQTTCNIFNNIYESNFIAMIDSFPDAIKCLSEFGQNQHFPDTSMEAIRLIRACARYVAEQPQYFKEFNIDADRHERLSSEDDRVWLRGWMPILVELSCIVTNCKLDVRTRALTVMFEIVKSHGHAYCENWWADLFQKIFRIFEHVPDEPGERAEWMTTTCNHALYSIVDVFAQYFDTLGGFLLKDLYKQLESCVKQNSEQLARSGINCLENLIVSCGVKYDSQTWAMTLEYMERIYKIVSPDGENITPEMARIRLLVQLDLVQAIDNIVFYPSMSKKQDNEIVAEIEIEIKNGSFGSVSGSQPSNSLSRTSSNSTSSSVTLTHKVNGFKDSKHSSEEVFPEKSQGMYAYMDSDVLLRLACFLTNIFDTANHLYSLRGKNSSLRNHLTFLAQQENKSLLCGLRILFALDRDVSDSQLRADVEKALIQTECKALKYFRDMENEYHRESWNSSVILILYNVQQMSEDKFRLHISAIYSYVCDLILLDLRPPLKVLVKRILVRLKPIVTTKNIPYSNSDDLIVCNGVVNSD